MTSGLNLAPADLDPLARRGTAAVLSREIAGDLLTPVGAFLIAFRATPHAFLLESVEGGSVQARYSFLGGGPRRLFRIRDGRPTLEDTGSPERPLPGDPIAALRGLWRDMRSVPQDGLPRLRGGLVGFFSYDLARALEHLPGTPRDDRRIPDAVLGDYDTILAFDHLRHRIVLMSRLDLRGSEADRRRSFDAARERVEALAARLHAGAPGGPLPPRGGQAGAVVAEPDAAAFRAAVVEAKQSIAAGEIFQIVLSRRFHVPWSGDPIAVYRALRSLNPSPYHFYLACGGDSLAGASPEMLVRVEGESVTCRPIAGTRPRQSEEEADLAMERELVADPKERAEHVMLVDLARNDLGRISRPGSVEVSSMASVERFSHVMHLVSTVRGRLAPGRDALDALAACFPAGTLTGAPKVRAMQLIDAMEPFRRGAYGGAVAYLDAGGDLDSCIAIRTIVLSGGKAFAQAGAGIVADSDPASELREIDHKAGALLEALETAGRPEALILVLDNYDSFTYNLVQLLAGFGAEVEVRRNDALSVEAALALGPRGIVISPGPGRPEAAGICLELVREAARRRLPLLGVCLGHQALGAAFGARVVPAPTLMHGKTSAIAHDGAGVFRGLPNPMEATRYHSLVLDRATLPPELPVTAWTDDGTIMGVRHVSLPLEGVQFHPESILTLHGRDLIANFLEAAR